MRNPRWIRAKVARSGRSGMDAHVFLHLRPSSVLFWVRCSDLRLGNIELSVDVLYDEHLVDFPGCRFNTKLASLFFSSS